MNTQSFQALFNNNSFLSSPWLGGLPYKYCLYNVDCLKTQMLSLYIDMYIDNAVFS
jgi:hypothetical protein